MKKRTKISTKVVDNPHVHRISFPTGFVVEGQAKDKILPMQEIMVAFV